MCFKLKWFPFTVKRKSRSNWNTVLGFHFKKVGFQIKIISFSHTDNFSLTDIKSLSQHKIFLGHIFCLPHTHFSSPYLSVVKKNQTRTLSLSLSFTYYIFYIYIFSLRHKNFISGTNIPSQSYFLCLFISLWIQIKK